MARRKFLIPLAIALSGLSQASTAALKPVAPPTSPNTEELNAVIASPLRFAMPEKGQSVNAIFPSGEDLFKFVLHRTEDGQLVAAHESHYSHSSHSSHSSHYSSR